MVDKPTAQNPIPPQPQIDSFIRNLVKIDEVSRTITGMPIDVLIARVQELAANNALPAIGRMMDFGPGPQLVPESKCLENWLTAFFQAAQRAAAKPEDEVGEK